LQRNAKWYEETAPAHPSSNNGLESINGTSKREHTLRERLPGGQFLRKVDGLLRAWSSDRDPSSSNCKRFAVTPSISLAEWTAAFHWAVRKVKMLQRTSSGGCRLYYAAASGRPEITTAQLCAYQKSKGQWSTFDDFKTQEYRVWVIKFYPDALEKCSCSCPYFLKHTICIHELGMKIRLKLVDVPQEAKVIPLGPKRKRGRPSMADSSHYIRR